MSSVLAVDIGGTKLEAALVDSDGRLVEGSRHRRATGPERSRMEITDELAWAIDAALAVAPGPVIAAGVGSAGPLDLRDGSVSPHNLPTLLNYPVRDIVERASGVSTAVRLDGTCIALAEHWVGATRGTSTSMSIVVSTGVGGGIVADGRLISGRSGNAGHIGQIHVAAEASGGPESTTLEAVASGPAAVAWARRRGWSGRTGEELAAAVRRGDQLAEEATRRSATYVGQAIASAATLLDLEAVALGGGFVNVRADYIELVRAAARENSIFEYSRSVTITKSGLSGTGPLIGAAALHYLGPLLDANHPLLTEHA